MAGASLLTLLDDIASVLDDVSLLTKVAAKKTAGVLGDDLALNAEQVIGVRADRELPVVWAVAKGSVINKVILVPVALILSALVPFIIGYLLLFGGGYLCFEGFEKLVHKSKKPESQRDVSLSPLSDSSFDLQDIEREKIRGAIRTDFVLSAEIIVIALGTVVDEPLGLRILALIAVAIVMTVGVYGLVALIVRMDDAGLALRKYDHPALKMLSRGLLSAAPKLMRALSVAGTVAMFLVGGGIIVHGLPPLAALLHFGSEQGWVQALRLLVTAVVGVLAGGLLWLIGRPLARLRH